MLKKSKYINNPFIVSFAFLIFAIIFLAIFFNKISRDFLTEQIQHRQQLAVRVTATSIDTFLNSIGKTAIMLSNNPDIDELDQFTLSWKDSKISGLIVTNERGIVTKNSNPLKIRDTGVDLSDREYFKWAKQAKKGEYKIFTPVISKVGTSKDKYIVTIATPIFVDNHFDGVLSIAVLLSDLTKSYLENLKVLDSGETYLVTSDGEILYSEQSGLTGENIKNIFKSDFIGKEKILNIISNELKLNEETKLNLAFPNFDNNFKLEPYLISASPILVSDNLWKVVVSVPEKDLHIFTYNFFNKQIIAIFIVVTLFILLTLRASRNSGYNEAVIDEHKKHNIT